MEKSHINVNNGKTFIILKHAYMAICSVNAPYECKVSLKALIFPVHFKYINKLTMSESKWKGYLS
jgi:hypothetical protein